MSSPRSSSSMPSENGGAGDEVAALPYTIELWSEDRTAVSKVLARAVSVSLARAIFAAAMTEYPDRRVTLRRGSRTIAKSPQ